MIRTQLTKATRWPVSTSTVNTGIPNTCSPDVTVITIDEPVTGDAVKMPKVMAVDLAVELAAEAVEPLQVQIDAHPAAPGVIRHAAGVVRHRADRSGEPPELDAAV